MTFFPPMSRLPIACFGLLPMLALPAATHAGPLEGLTITPTKDPGIFKLSYKPDAEKDSVDGFVAYPKGIGPFRTVIVNHSPDGNAMKVAFNYFPHILDRGYAAIGFNVSYAAQPEESDWKENVRRLSAFLEIIQNDEKLDSKNIFMFGNGWGATVSLVFSAHTDKLRAVAVTGGGRVPKEAVDYSKISVPFLLVHGANDESVPLDAAMKLKANLERADKKAEIKVIEKSGHEVVMFKAAEVFDAIVAFFNKQAK